MCVLILLGPCSEAYTAAFPAAEVASARRAAAGAGAACPVALGDALREAGLDVRHPGATDPRMIPYYYYIYLHMTGSYMAIVIQLYVYS